MNMMPLQLIEHPKVVEGMLSSVLGQGILNYFFSFPFWQ